MFLGVEGVAHGGDLEVRLRLEHAPSALADEIVVLGQDDPNRHVAKDTSLPAGLHTNVARQRLPVSKKWQLTMVL